MLLPLNNKPDMLRIFRSCRLENKKQDIEPCSIDLYCGLLWNQTEQPERIEVSLEQPWKIALNLLKIGANRTL